ncbi:hypothetical protein IVB38_37015 [Bradyrhizobium sp. 38]|uniref:hypothetical protein n=1 Tax=unclassified Bradyrhizobium TaxID=2631580 RepID=UPI001FF856C7|nr:MULTISPECIES: hypothetical protein [unclassified Bradyrhizobium]MCK1341446.1 hypothetical protein [Bradyrhizobium sp. 38]MCK1782663.1 hypothetical protein [Bradyrhizobium sp. 132]
MPGSDRPTRKHPHGYDKNAYKGRNVIERMVLESRPQEVQRRVWMLPLIGLEDSRPAIPAIQKENALFKI